jgi:hypothetical protein
VTAFNSKLSSNQVEVMNRHLLVSRAIEKGFNAFLPVYDDGIDLILHGGIPAKTYLVQLKSRWTIERKYTGRSIYIAFPYEAAWYLYPHDDMIEHCRTNTRILETKSWKVDAVSNSDPPPKAIAPILKQYKF